MSLVVLVNPMVQLNGWGCYYQGKSIDRQCNSLPHGLLSIATVLKQSGTEAHILDLRDMRDWSDYARRIISLMPDWVAVGSMSVDIFPALEAMRIAKEILPEVKTVIGGVHASQNPEELAAYDYVDYVFQYEGEVTFPKMVSGEYVPEGKIVKGDMPDLDALPYIDRNLVPYERGELNYGAYWMGKYPYVTMMAGRGCPFKCSFCSPVSLEVFRKARQRSIEHLIGELKECKEKWNANYFDFIDDTFTIKKTWTMEFCDAYEQSELKIPFVVAARADIICRNEDMFKRLREVGCDTVSVGFESGSDRILQLLNKGTTVEQNLQAARILKKHGYFIASNIIYGSPTETVEEAQATADMVRKIQPNVNMFSFFTPYPGCDLFDWCVERDLLLFDPKDYSQLHRYSTGPKIKGVDYAGIRKVMYTN